MFRPQTRILIVDDQAQQQAHMRMELRAIGFTGVAATAFNGKEALDVLQNAFSSPEPIELIFTDWQMPEMSGIELVRALRADERFKKLPIIMVSALNKKEEVVEALKAGANNYLFKSFKREELHDKLRKLWDSLQKKS